MVLFLAEVNEQVDLNDYHEVRNRALVVPIDDSKDLTERVNTMEAGLYEPKVSDQRAEGVG